MGKTIPRPPQTFRAGMNAAGFNGVSLFKAAGQSNSPARNQPGPTGVGRDYWIEFSALKRGCQYPFRDISPIREKRRDYFPRHPVRYAGRPGRYFRPAQRHRKPAVPRLRNT